MAFNSNVSSFVNSSSLNLQSRPSSSSSFFFSFSIHTRNKHTRAHRSARRQTRGKAKVFVKTKIQSSSSMRFGYQSRNSFGFSSPLPRRVFGRCEPRSTPKVCSARELISSRSNGRAEHRNNSSLPVEFSVRTI